MADSYRVQRRYEGKRYSLTFNHYPTEKEIQKALFEKISDASKTLQKAREDLSFDKAVQSYIELKKDRNSPSTTKCYYALPKKFSDSFREKSIFALTQLDIDKEIASWIKEGLSYKTMKNYISMAMSVITKFGGERFNFDMLPEKPKPKDNDVYIPSKDDVKKILLYVRDNYPKQYIPIWLATYGLRRGEIYALTVDDVDEEEGLIRITKDAVTDVNGNIVVKEPKTQASVRTIAVSKDLCRLIHLQGRICTGHINSFGKALYRTEKALGIPMFSIHKMRHYCCSELYDMGCTETDIEAYMGWDNESEVMRHIYRHSRLKTDMVRQRDIADKLAQNIS